MTPPEYDEQQRRELVRRAEQEDREADANLAKAQARKRETEAKRLRAESAADDPSLGTEFCLDCWVEMDERVPMTNQPGGYGEDVLRCRNGHERRVQVR